MSFFSDLFEGHWENLGTDITHAPSSFANHPEEWAEVAGAGALIAAPFLIPEIGAGLAGAFGAADLGALAGGELAGAEFAGALGGGELAGALEGGGLAGAEFAGDALAFAPEFTEGGAGLSEWLAAPDAAFGGGAADALALQAPEATAAAEAAIAAPAESGLTTLPAGTPSVNAATTATGIGPGTGGVAAPAVSGGAVAGADGGLTGALSGALKSPWTQLAFGLAPLGLALGRGQPSLPPQAQSAAALAANPGAAGTRNPA